MNMDCSVAQLYTETPKYPYGSPVECVIACENIGLSLSVTPCWCYAPKQST